MRSDRPLILGIDTAAAHCAAALVSGDAVLARRSEPAKAGQAERLMPFLEEFLAEAGRAWADLDGLAVGTGPGHFTGIRVGVAAVRGLALALGIPAIGVTRSEALAEGRSGPVLVTLDGGRGLLAAQAFHDGLAVGAPALLALDDLAPPPGALCLGHRAGEIAARWRREAGSEETAPDPAAVARLGAARLGTAAPPPAPVYLRPPDAAPSAEAPPLILDDA